MIKKLVFSTFFTALMAMMGGAGVTSFMKSHLPEWSANEVEKADVPTVRSFAAIYPFAKGEEPLKEDEEATIKSGFLRNFEAQVDYMKSGFEVYTKGTNKLALSFLYLANELKYHEQGDLIYNDGHPFVRQPKGYYTFLYPYCRPVEVWSALLDFTKWAQKEKVRFVAMLPIDKGDDAFSVFPENVPHGYTQMMQDFTRFLDRYGIAYLETKPALLKENSDFFYWFYKTDHHWNAHAGLQVAKTVATYLNNELGLKADTAAVCKENYRLVVYPKSFLGSMGRALGPKYMEDMEVYFPINETKMHIQIPSMGRDRTGAFAKTVIAEHGLAGSTTSYDAFLNGDQTLVRIENMLAENNTRVLVVKHSKADVVCPYLAMTVRYLDVIDPRSFDGSIRTFIKQTKPDVVMTCMDVPWRGEEHSWNIK